MVTKLRDNIYYSHLEQEVGPAVAVHSVTLVAVVLLLGVGASPDHQASLLPRPRLQGALSKQELELARGEGVQESRVGEVVIILDVIDDLGAHQGLLTQETLHQMFRYYRDYVI